MSEFEDDNYVGNAGNLQKETGPDDAASAYKKAKTNLNRQVISTIIAMFLLFIIASAIGFAVFINGNDVFKAIYTLLALLIFVIVLPSYYKDIRKAADELNAAKGNCPETAGEKSNPAAVAKGVFFGFLALMLSGMVLAIVLGEIQGQKEKAAVEAVKYKSQARQENATQRTTVPYMDSMRDSMPYVGLDSKLVRSTIMKSPTKTKCHNNDDGTSVFTFEWYVDNFKILSVTTKDSKVTSVNRYGGSKYWKNDGYPLSSTLSALAAQAESSRKAFASDPYNVNEYSSPEDFYYWQKDDFVDYEEAEEYYYAHNE